MVYIALLRGINVGGHTVKMEQLRNYFSQMGFTNVRSFIQSGNIFFDSDKKDTQELQKTIQEQLKKSLGYDVPVCLRTVDELEKIAESNPFKGIELKDNLRFAINFLAQPVQELLPIPYTTPDGGYEVVKMTPTELYVVWHLKNGRPGKSYGSIEKKLNVASTTRFWHTTAKILAAAKDNH